MNLIAAALVAKSLLFFLQGASRIKPRMRLENEAPKACPVHVYEWRATDQILGQFLS